MIEFQGLREDVCETNDYIDTRLEVEQSWELKGGGTINIGRACMQGEGGVVLSGMMLS